jgi:hypothetical protein
MESKAVALASPSEAQPPLNVSAPAAVSAATPGIRTDAVERGVRFLNNGDLRLVPREDLGKFLGRVGLTSDEIQAAFQRSNTTLGNTDQLIDSGKSMASTTGLAVASASPLTAAASALSPPVEHPAIASRWTAVFTASAAGLLAGYLWSKLDLRSKIQDWLDDGMPDDSAREATALNETTTLRLPGIHADTQHPNSLQGLAQSMQDRPIAEPNHPVASVTELQAQRSQITDALENVRRIERENAAGLNELRMLLKDMNVTMHTTLTGLQNEQSRTQMTMNTSVQALATDVSGLRRDMSMLSSDISSMSKSYIASPAPAVSMSHVLTDLSDHNDADTSATSQERPVSLPSLRDGMPLPNISIPSIREATVCFHTSLLLVCSFNAAAAIEYGFPTLRMIIQNLISKPDAPRYRRIVTTNDIIRKSIIRYAAKYALDAFCPHAMLSRTLLPCSLRKHRELLAALGFVEEQLAWKWAPSGVAPSSAFGTQEQAIFLQEADKLIMRTAELSNSHPELFGLDSVRETGLAEGSEHPIADVPYQHVVRMVLENRAAELPGIKHVSEGISVDAEKLLTHQELAPLKPWQVNKEGCSVTSSEGVLSPIPMSSPSLTAPLGSSHVTHRKGPRGRTLHACDAENVPSTKTFLDAIALAADGLKSPS